MSDTHRQSLPTIASVFQPIVSLAHQAPTGYEALLRAVHDGHRCSPDAAFELARRLDREGEFDRACVRYHIGRFASLALEDAVLFVNVHPRTLGDPVHGPGLISDMLNCGMPASRIVIEILEDSASSGSVLVETVAQLRERGFLIALDDFGTGQTNLGRAWDLQPDLVKLDRELICKAAGNDRNARSLRRLVELLHDIGTFVVVEGVETEAEALLSMACDADFGQGFYFARPSESVGEDDCAHLKESGLAAKVGLVPRLIQVSDMPDWRSYQYAFAKSVDAFVVDCDLQACSRHFFDLERSLRVFVLGINGAQIGNTIESSHERARAGSRFPLLGRQAGANWSKRAYFRNALRRPGEIVVSEPYMTSASATLCVTLSIYLSTTGNGCVLCGDVLFEAPV